jgi:hypothetical protein
MNAFWMLTLAAAALAQNPVEKPRIGHAAIAALEKSFDTRVLKVSATDPLEVMSAAQGVYLEGFGAVFTAQLDLIVTPTVNPFRQTMSEQEVARVRERKANRLPVLRSVMKEMMMETAVALRGMPGHEQVVVAVSLFHFNWEDTSGLPAQIVMRAPRRELLARASADSAIQVQEY